MKSSVKRKARKAKPSPTRKQPIKKKAKSNIILTTLAVGAAGILGYLGWQYYKKRKSSAASSNDLSKILKQSQPIVFPSASTGTTATPAYTTPASVIDSSTSKKSSGSTTTANSGFPLKKGSKGTLVKTLQQALIAKYGTSILPKYGADGDFGSETVTAATKAGLPATIDESTYYVFIQGNNSADKSALAAKFLTAASNKDFNAVMSLLKQMNTKEDYRQVSNIFVQSILRGVRQTLVNGLLGSFTNETQKQQIRYEFIRMGLKYDGSKWSLDGFDGRPVVTIEPTSIWINATESVSVPASMVLGAEVSRRLDYTLFENNNRYFLVASKSIKYL